MTWLLIRSAIVCSVLAILLPAHPGLQGPLRFIGIPPSFLSFVLATGIVYVGVKRNLLSKQVLYPILLYGSFAFIILTRALMSPALGLDNYWLSLRGILILSPLAILSALATRHGTRVASFTVCYVGFFAIVLYVYLILFGDILSVSGFRSLSNQSGKENYQATAFYFGLAAIGLMVSVDYQVGLKKLIVFLGFLFVFLLMTTIGARASIVAIGLCFFIYYISRLFLSPMLWIWLSLWITIFLSLFLYFYYNNEFISKSLTAIERFQYIFGDEDSSSRIILFSSAIKLWLKSPLNLFFGAGLGAFPAYIGENDPGWYPHNFILEALAEGGIFGAFPILLMIYMVLKRFFKDLMLQNIEWERRYFGYCSIYSIVSFFFMGGFSTLWIPVFFIFTYIFVKPSNYSSCCKQTHVLTRREVSPRLPWRRRLKPIRDGCG